MSWSKAAAYGLAAGLACSSLFSPEKACSKEAAPTTLEKKVQAEALKEETKPAAAKPFKVTYSPWVELEKGLHYGEFAATQKSILGDSKISVLKVDLAHYDLVLLTALEQGGSRTAPEWVKEYGLAAVTNAGMFEPDLTSTGYMRNYDHVNKVVFKPGYNSLLAFNPKTPGLPLAQILDSRCQNLAEAGKKYQSVSQSIRMIDCQGKNTWPQSKRKWSQAALAMDKEGHPLFIHSRSPYTVHDFNEQVLALPIRVRNMLYLEGGPEASLYIDTSRRKIGKVGSFETGFNENDGNQEFWGLPNVVGVKKR